MFYLLNMAHNKIGTWEREENRREKTVNTEIEMQYRVLSLIHQMTFFFPQREKNRHTQTGRRQRETLTATETDRDRQGGRETEGVSHHKWNQQPYTQPIKQIKPGVL